MPLERHNDSGIQLARLSPFKQLQHLLRVEAASTAVPSVPSAVFVRLKRGPPVPLSLFLPLLLYSSISTSLSGTVGDLMFSE